MESAEMQARDDKIRRLAYEIWRREGGPDGRAEEHWHTAMREIAMAEEEAVEATAFENAGAMPISTGQDKEQAKKRRGPGRAKMPAPHRD